MGVLYRTMSEDGTLQGALWVAQAPQPGAVNAGATTHLPEMPHRLAWLAQGLAHAVRSGLAPEDALAEVAALSNSRWSLDRTSLEAASLAACRTAMARLGTPDQAPPPALEAALEAPLEDTQAPAPAPAKRPSGAQRRKAAAALAAATDTEGTK